MCHLTPGNHQSPFCLWIVIWIFYISEFLQFDTFFVWLHSLSIFLKFHPHYSIHLYFIIFVAQNIGFYVRVWGLALLLSVQTGHQPVIIFGHWFTHLQMWELHSLWKAASAESSGTKGLPLKEVWGIVCCFPCGDSCPTYKVLYSFFLLCW
jgi:hypothetical protein